MRTHIIQGAIRLRLHTVVVARRIPPVAPRDGAIRRKISFRGHKITACILGAMMTVGGQARARDNGPCSAA